MTQHWFKTLFAATGTKTAVPDAADPSGYISYDTGYGPDYQRVLGTDPLAKTIERDKLNQVLYDMTGAIQQYQVHAFPEFITTANNGGTPFAYDVDAIVRYDSGGGFNLYQNTTAANTNIPTGAGWVLKIGGLASITSPALTGTVSINGANVTAYGKNYIINGGFDYWNYATSQTTSGYGSDDRWFNNNLGSTKTHSLVNATDTERALFNSSKFSRTVVTSVAGTANNVHKRQLIENVTKLAGKTVTISFWAKADASKNIAIECIQNFGTGGTPSTQVTGIGSQLVALTTTWQKKSITVTIPSIVGKTLGTDGVHTSSLFFTLWFDAGSDLNTRTANLGQQSGTFDIAEVKLEEGSVATPWTPYEGEFGGEVQACQRYLPVIKGLGAVGMGRVTATATNTTILVNFPSITRVPASGIILSNLSHFNIGDSVSVLTPSALAFSSSSPLVATLAGTTLAFGGTLRPCTLNAVSSDALILFTGCEL